LRDENFGVAVSGLVQDEIGIFGAILEIAHFREQALAQPRALDGFEILFWDNHVGIDIGDFERRRDTGERGELFHFCILVFVKRFGGVGLLFENGHDDTDVSDGSVRHRSLALTWDRR
jgi:hypothetical protein